MAMLTRGRLAREAGIHSETIRYYERTGLLKQPARTPAGYRQYDAGVLRRLAFIKHAQSLGFTLSEIAELLELQFDSRLSCEHMQQQIHAKVSDIDAKVAALTALRGSLLALAERCDIDCACGSNCTALLAVARMPRSACVNKSGNEQNSIVNAAYAGTCSIDSITSTTRTTEAPSQSEGRATAE